MEAITPIIIEPLPDSSGRECMAKKTEHRGRMYRVELPEIEVPPGKEPVLYLCEGHAAQLILDTAS